MILLKSEKEIEKIRRAGKIGALILKELSNVLKAGVTTKDLESIAVDIIIKNNAKPAFKGYNGFPANICISVNEEVIHGIPGNKILNEGDIVSIDAGIYLCNGESLAEGDAGYFADVAATYAVGEVMPESKKLLEVTEKALYLAIDECKTGNRIGDISAKVQSYVESNGFSVVRDFVGHGIGRKIHEEPQIPNFGRAGYGPRIKNGMVFCIEPMVNIGTSDVEVSEDKWTVVTNDKKRSAHFEHTVAITENGAEVLTIL